MNAMVDKPLFLDTTVLLSGVTASRSASHEVLFEYPVKKYTNEYAVKETRWVMKEKLHLNYEIINDAVDAIRQNCSVAQTPSKEEMFKINLVDEADVPILCSAIKLSCILVTRDRGLLNEAKSYIEAKTPEQIIAK